MSKPAFLTIFVVLIGAAPALVCSFKTCSPVIGILSQEPKHISNTTYIAASYVKFVESAGACVVPIMCSWSPEKLVEVAKKLDGVLFPGGVCVLQPGHCFYDAAAVLYQHIKASNEAGEYYPLHGTCQGFEALLESVANDTNILERFNGSDMSNTLSLTHAASRSRTFGGLRPSLRRRLQTAALTYENHKFGITPRTLSRNHALRAALTVLSTSTDRSGVEFVSTVESSWITATQWHPEKNAFEWTTDAMPHTEDAVMLAQHVANVFVSAARKRAAHRLQPAQHGTAGKPISCGSVSLLGFGSILQRGTAWFRTTARVFWQDAVVPQESAMTAPKAQSADMGGTTGDLGVDAEQDIADLLIYNFAPVFSGKGGYQGLTYFEQVYLFNDTAD